MIDLRINSWQLYGVLGKPYPDHFDIDSIRLLLKDDVFTKSNGSIMSRVYERLTKASRRRVGRDWNDEYGQIKYREGVYDTLAALRDELS